MKTPDQTGLRLATDADIAWIIRQETDPANRLYVSTLTPAAHARNLGDPDHRYFVLEDGEAVGFAIIRGLADPSGVIELRRIIAARPGRGYGAALLRAIQGFVFDERKCRKLWLDVVDSNARAISVYNSCGFTREGHLREHYVTTDGRICGLYVFGMLRREFERQRADQAEPG